MIACKCDLIQKMVKKEEKTDHFILKCIFLSTFGNASRVECHSVAETITFPYSETVFDLCNYKLKFKFIHINRVAPLELHINNK